MSITIINSVEITDKPDSNLVRIICGIAQGFIGKTLGETLDAKDRGDTRGGAVIHEERDFPDARSRDHFSYGFGSGCGQSIRCRDIWFWS